MAYIIRIIIELAIIIFCVLALIHDHHSGYKRSPSHTTFRILHQDN